MNLEEMKKEFMNNQAISESLILKSSLLTWFIDYLFNRCVESSNEDESLLKDFLSKSFVEDFRLLPVVNSKREELGLTDESADHLLVVLFSDNGKYKIHAYQTNIRINRIESYPVSVYDEFVSKDKRKTTFNDFIKKV